MQLFGGWLVRVGLPRSPSVVVSWVALHGDASQLGLTMPLSLLGRADEVIE